MHRVVSLLFLLALALGCTTPRSSRPASIPQPDIVARLVNPLHFGGGDVSPANIDVTIRNRATVPIILRRIEIDSPGMRQYTLDRAVRTVRETIPPGESKNVTVFARAIALITRNPDEPLNIRTIVELEGGGSVWREVLMMR